MLGENQKEKNAEGTDLSNCKIENFENRSLKKETVKFCNQTTGNSKCSNINDNDSQILKSKIKAVTSLVKELEDNILEANQNDKKIFLKIQTDSMKNQILSSQLENAKKENKQLMNVLQQRYGDQTSSRTTSRSTMDCSYSTVSMVNLQYKYEELLANYEGLLKVLDTKGKEVNKCYSENEDLRNQVRDTSTSLTECQQEISKICKKYLVLKQRKDRKISELKEECKALRLAHDNLVDMLNKFSLEQDKEYEAELRKTKNPEKALLLNEIRRSNNFQHENLLLRQEVNYLRSKLKRKAKEKKCSNNSDELRDILEKNE